MEKARDRYQHLFEEAPIGICLVGKDGKYLSANTFYAQLYGYDSVQEMFALVPDFRSVFIHDKDWQSFIGLMRRQGKVVDFECKVRCKYGNQIWTSRTAREVLDSKGEVLHYEIFVMDIQVRKEAALAAMLSRRQLLNVLEQLEAGVYVMNPDDNRIIYANRYITEIIGRNLVGQEAPNILLKEEGNCPFCFGDKDTQDPGVQSAELQFTDNRWYLCTAKLTPWLGGEAVVLVVAMDITAAKEAEEMKADMDRIARHDLKGPLNAIIGVPELLIATGAFSEDDVELLQGVGDAGKKMLNLIDSSLSLYRLEKGDYHIEPDEIDIVREMELIEKEVAREAESKGLEIVYMVGKRHISSTDYISFHGDRTLTSFMFSNLLKNAVEASPRKGKISITIKCDEVLVIEMSNQGVVPEDIRERFFDKYVTSGKTKGSGLGTYSARLIAEAHGGEIGMFTSEDGGTTVIVKLPREGRT
ncbi:MAG: PAS domain-containing sensor histidine kinase [Desulfovibrionales bacterium]